MPSIFPYKADWLVSVSRSVSRSVSPLKFLITNKDTLISFAFFLPLKTKKPSFQFSVFF